MLKGAFGEFYALSYLVELGYIWLVSNLRSKSAEIDLLFIHPEFNKVVIVEVKTTSNFDWYQESVNRLQLRKFYLRENLAKSFSRSVGLGYSVLQHDLINIFTEQTKYTNQSVNKVEHFQDIYI